MEVLFRFADLIDRNAESLAVLETLDMGKPIGDVVTSDLPAVIDTIRFMAECIDKVEGAVTSTESSVMHMVLREPLGVVGAISPWNYPLLMATWKIAPALAAGNTVVLKPAEQAPMSCLRLAELFVEAGGPPGVFNVVNGMGEVAGKALALHGDVAKVELHRLHRGRQADTPVRRPVEHEARGAGVRRQVSTGIHGRPRRSRPCRHGRLQGDLFQHGRSL